MDSLTTAAASGMRSRSESLEMLANNIANATSTGFKEDREFYGLYTAAEADAGSASPAPELPVIERHWTNFSQGTLTNTGNPFDLALAGGGFFIAQSPGGALYTRNGNFRLSPSGQIETQDGYPVLSSDAKPILVDPSRPVQITPDGSVQQDGQLVAQIGVADISDPSVLSKQGQTYFRFSASQPPPQLAAPEIHQAALESANAQPAEAAVKLVGVLRQFEMLQKAMSMGTDMNRRAIEEVAKLA
jgi:flagellar basal-body rod protein FlgF